MNSECNWTLLSRSLKLSFSRKNRSGEFKVKSFFAAVLGVIVSVGSLSLFAKENSNGKEIQQTLSIIKPDAVAANKIGPITAHIEAAGLSVVAMRMTQLTGDQAAMFYAAHKERPFYKSLVTYMSSAPVVLMVLEGDNAVESYRDLMGATDPAKARKGTLRREFGTNVEKNAVHGSDSMESAKREIAFFFNPNQIFSRKS